MTETDAPTPEIEHDHFLEPALYLILSADLVDSTALKHQPLRQYERFSDVPLAEAEGPADDAEAMAEAFDRLSPAWLPKINTFHADITEPFLANWQSYKPAGLDIAKGESPRFWKTRGDEILFRKRLGNFEQASLVMHCWLKAIRAFQKKHDGELSVKSTAWLIGVPFTNSQVVFIRDQEAFEKELNDSERVRFKTNHNPVVRQHYLLHLYFKEWQRFGKHLEVDMVGPSVDQGFRITEHATERRCPVSVELAYILAGANEQLLQWNLKFYGFEKLRGVLNNSAYPLLGLDLWSERETPDSVATHNDNLSNDELETGRLTANARRSLSDAEAALSSRYSVKNNDGSLIDYLRNYVWAHHPYLMVPYIYRLDSHEPEGKNHHICANSKVPSADFRDQQHELDRIEARFRATAKRRYEIWCNWLRMSETLQPPNKDQEPDDLEPERQSPQARTWLSLFRKRS